MLATSSKKIIIVCILEILKKYSDEDHRLSQSEIQQILQDEYELNVDRKAIKRNLLNLIDFGFMIQYDEKVRMNKDVEEIVYSNWYLERDFSDSELCLLIDNLLFSKNIPYSQCKELINKLQGLSSCHFVHKVNHIQNLPEDMPQNKELFYNIDIINEAIEKNKQISFNYNDFGIDKKLHPRCDDENHPRNYVINPYHMVATNGRYYLICNNDKYDNVSNYRIDRISNVKILDDSKCKSKRKVNDLDKGLDLPKHMAEHIYMFNGVSEFVTFTADKHIISEIIDWFGNNVYFYDETDTEVCVRVKVNLNAMRFWALQYSSFVTVTSPQVLVDRVKEMIQIANERYK